MKLRPLERRTRDLRVRSVKRNRLLKIRPRHVSRVLATSSCPLIKPIKSPTPTKVILSIESIYQKLEDKARNATFEIFCDPLIQVVSGDFVSILGPSGCGKTTLLTLLGLLRRPHSINRIGRFQLNTAQASGESNLVDLKLAWKNGMTVELEKIRAKEIGFALQSGELLNALNVKENIAVPMNLNGFSRDEIDSRCNDLLDAFGLHGSKDSVKGNSKKIASSRINTLSGGEYQRVVLARSISHKPQLVFVDEPTAALNRELARISLKQLKELLTGDKSSGAVIMITHDETLAMEFSTKIIRMEPLKDRPAGRVASVTSNIPSI